MAYRPIIPIAIAGSRSSPPLGPPSGKTRSVRSAKVGGWTRPLSRSKAGGCICSAPLTRKARPSTSFLPPAATQRPLCAFSRKPFGNTVYRTRSDRQEQRQCRGYRGAPSGNWHRIEIRQIKYLNNLVEQDHRAIKRIVRPMLGFQSFRSARTTLQGIELMHMIKKGQMVSDDSQDLSAAEQFYSLAA